MAHHEDGRHNPPEALSKQVLVTPKESKPLELEEIVEYEFVSAGRLMAKVETAMRSVQKKIKGMMYIMPDSV